jgi:hypothetical protein
MSEVIKALRGTKSGRPKRTQSEGLRGLGSRRPKRTRSEGGLKRGL